MNIENKIAKASKNLLFNEAFYGLFLTTLNKKYNNSIPTAGVSLNGINYELIINKDYVNDLSMDHTLGLLKHELLHIAFNHILISKEFKSHKIFNIAADLEINQYIDEKFLPQGGLLLSTFPELKLPEKAGLHEYYKILENAKENGNCPSLNNILQQMDGDSPYNHDTWQELNNLSDAEKKLIHKQKKYIFKEIKKSIEKYNGVIPNELKEIIDSLDKLEESKFDWKSYFRRFIGNSYIIYTKKLKRKFNKRYEENPGLKIKSKNHILVAIDTSGSVNNDELKEFINEVNHIHKSGHLVTLIQCDSDISSVEKFKRNTPITILGRGGTSFQPVINYFNDKKIYTTLVYLTDGECEAPINTPKNTLWVLSSQSKLTNHLPGKTIKL